jgi:hypothetical protein
MYTYIYVYVYAYAYIHLCVYLYVTVGTYVKEFVHGDLGRTSPSVCGILDCQVDILQLDVVWLFDDFEGGGDRRDDIEINLDTNKITNCSKTDIDNIDKYEILDINDCTKIQSLSWNELKSSKSIQQKQI